MEYHWSICMMSSVQAHHQRQTQLRPQVSLMSTCCHKNPTPDLKLKYRKASPVGCSVLLQQCRKTSYCNSYFWAVTPWTELICMWIYSQIACFIYSYSRKCKNKTSTLTTSPVQDTKKHYMHTEACAWLCNKNCWEKNPSAAYSEHYIPACCECALPPPVHVPTAPLKSPEIEKYQETWQNSLDDPYK